MTLSPFCLLQRLTNVFQSAQYFLECNENIYSYVVLCVKISKSHISSKSIPILNEYFFADRRIEKNDIYKFNSFISNNVIRMYRYLWYVPSDSPRMCHGNSDCETNGRQKLVVWTLCLQSYACLSSPTATGALRVMGLLSTNSAVNMNHAVSKDEPKTGPSDCT
jgi:hypothetical protein